jgi:hypothetical protein
MILLVIVKGSERNGEMNLVAFTELVLFDWGVGASPNTVKQL